MSLLNNILNPATAILCGWVAYQIRLRNRPGAFLLACIASANVLVFTARFIH